MKYSLRNINVRYFFLQVLFWGAAVVNYAYMTQILQNKGFSSEQIGILNGVKLLVGVIFQIWIGAFADRTRYTVPLKYLIALLSMGAVVLTAALYYADNNFVLMFFISLGFGITFTTLQPLIDSLPMLYTSHGLAVNYAKGRMGGSISWAILCVVAGMYCDGVGLSTFPIWGIVIMMVLTIISVCMPWEGIRLENNTEADITEQPKTSTVWELLRKYPIFLVFLIGSVVMFMGYNFGCTFLIDIYRDLGGGNTEYGIGEFVMAISEVPSAFIILKLRNKIPLRHMMVCCAFFMMLKNLIPTYAVQIPVVICSQACEMLGFGLYYAGSMYFIEENLPKADIVKGASLVSVATVGIGEGIAACLCGVIRNRFGLYGLMKIGTLTNLLSIIIFLWMCTLKNKKYGNEN